MKGRSLLALPALVLALACEGNNQPTGPGVPTAPSPVISDGAHGVDGNPDFFFLPPLVQNPVSDPDFEAGKFNASLQPSLSVEICELQGGPGTDCGPLVKVFPAGTVRLQNPPDGFYQVLWNTRQSNLILTKFYRIMVMIEGSNVPLGFADVDPMSNKAFQNALTGEVIPLIDDTTLPIPFRVENIGALCTGATLCSSVTVTNDNPNGDATVVQVEGNNGPLAGALFPDGWLPANGPQSVIVTITSVNTGVNDVAAGTQANPCHANLPLQQFNGCFNFTTTPALDDLAEGGHQFALPVTVAVCYVLHDAIPEDPREPWVQLWSSGPNEPAHPLVSVSDALILTNPTEDNCGTNFTVIASNAPASNALAQLASAGWQKLKGGLGRAFGVKTAYAVDLGLGGLALDFSNIGPALTAQIQPYTSTGLTLGLNSTTTSTARIVGTQVHNGGALTTGIPGLPVTFTVAAGNGTLRAVGSEAAPASEVIVLTDAGGFASVNWTMPNIPGTYTLTATGPATGGPVTFTATVPADRRMLSMQTGATIQLSATAPDVVATWLSSDPTKVQVSATGLATAIVGGENSNGGDGATVTSVLTTGSVGPMWLVNTPFDIFPRITTAVWAPVAAASYDVAIEFGNGCTGYANCTTWSPEGGATGIAGSSSNFTFSFVGTQPGRWHVTARDASGAILSISPWIYFRYIDGL